MLLFPWNFGFSATTYHWVSKPVPLDLACLKSYIHTTQAISMHFSQSKSTKCKFLGCLLNSPCQKNKKTSILRGQSVQKGLKICIFSQKSPQENHVVSRAVLHKVSLTFGQPLGQADLQSDYPQGVASSGLDQYYVRSVWHLVSLWFKLTFSQMYPPSRGIVGPRVVLSCVQLTWAQMYPQVEAPGGQQQY